MRRVPSACGLLVIAALAGCGKPSPGLQPLPAPRTLEPAAAAAIIDAHNQRVEMLRRVHASGVLQFRWQDEDGDEHFEPQVNAKLWIRAPRQTALRAEKMGEVLFWVGSDVERYWLFDFVSDEKGLHVGRHDGEAAGDEGLLLVRPLVLLDLLGVTPIADRAAAVTVTDGPWQIAAAGAGGPVRIFIDPSSGLPERVESLSRDGSVVLTSTLQRYKSVDLAGMAIAARPKFPTMIDITDPGGTISVKLAFDALDDETPERLFDLETLIEHLQ